MATLYIDIAEVVCTHTGLPNKGYANAGRRDSKLCPRCFNTGVECQSVVRVNHQVVITRSCAECKIWWVTIAGDNGNGHHERRHKHHPQFRPRSKRH